MTRVFARACAKGENGGVSKVAGLHSEWWHKFIVCGPCAGAGGERESCSPRLYRGIVRSKRNAGSIRGRMLFFFFFLSFLPSSNPISPFIPKERREGGKERGRKEGRNVRVRDADQFKRRRASRLASSYSVYALLRDVCVLTR